MEQEAKTGVCCICLEEAVIGVECELCREGKCCWPCSLVLAESDSLRTCPVCRQDSWRGPHAPIAVTPSGQEPSRAHGSPRHVPAWEYFDQDDDETVCLHLAYIGMCGERFRPTRVLSLLVGSWLQGLVVMSIVYGDLITAADTNTVAVLCAGELIAATCAFVAVLC